MFSASAPTEMLFCSSSEPPLVTVVPPAIVPRATACVMLSTPVEIQFDGSGNIFAVAPNTGVLDSGVDYLIDKTYRMTMTLDFVNNNMTATAQTLTDGGPVVNLGTVNYDNAFETNLVNNGALGGIIMRDQDGTAVVYDDLQVIPEAAMLGLFALGAPLYLSRKR